MRPQRVSAGDCLGGDAVSGTFVLVGNPGPEHVGRHFRDAAGDLGIETVFLDLRRAHASVLQKVSWHLRGIARAACGRSAARSLRRAGTCKLGACSSPGSLRPAPPL